MSLQGREERISFLNCECGLGRKHYHVTVRDPQDGGVNCSKAGRDAGLRSCRTGHPQLEVSGVGNL